MSMCMMRWRMRIATCMTSTIGMRTAKMIREESRIRIGTVMLRSCIGTLIIPTCIIDMSIPIRIGAQAC